MNRIDKHNRRIDEENKVKAPKREWKDELYKEIKYVKYVIRILVADGERWWSDEKRKEQYYRTVNNYKKRLESLNNERQEKMKIAIKEKAKKEIADTLEKKNRNRFIGF